jgi:mRNA interferase RelE/StbE
LIAGQGPRAADESGGRPGAGPLKKKLAEQLIEPRIPASRMRGCSDRTKIKLRAAGFRLVVEVRDHTKVPVLVVAAGKRERNAGYRQAAQR